MAVNTYLVHTAQGGLYTLKSSNLDESLDPKGNLIGRQFLQVDPIGGGSPTFLNITAITQIIQQPSTPKGASTV